MTQREYDAFCKEFMLKVGDPVEDEDGNLLIELPPTPDWMRKPPKRKQKERTLFDDM